MVDAIIQARFNASRLPGKVLMDISEKPILWHVIERIKLSKKIGRIILAIPDTKENDILEDYAKKNNVEYFRGSEEDVLARFYFAAKKFNCRNILRVCADRPLLDPELNNFVIDKYFESKADYISTRIKHTFPEGLTVEVMNFNALEKAFNEAKGLAQREHVTPYIYGNPDKFNIASVENSEDLSYMRWTVDQEEDLHFIRKVFDNLYKNKVIFTFKSTVNFLKKNPKITKINQQINQVVLKEQEKDVSKSKFLFN